MSRSTYGDEPNLKWMLHHCFTYMSLFKDICLGGVMAISSCVSHHILSILIPGKSFMKFGIKKSHEMISSIPIGICPIKLMEL
jgi:hypothetical protein